MSVEQAATGVASGPSRVAAPDEAISMEELALATRNSGLPLEALRYDVTPAGLHYLLIHYDVPAVDPAAWALDVDGRVATPLRLTLSELQARETVTTRVTLECAGNGRARMHPRPVSQPWLVEAVGTAEWTGTPLAPLLREAGLLDGAVSVVFTGADHGIERGEEQDYQRSLRIGDALSSEVLLAWEMNGQPLPPQHGFPLRLVVPGWYGMASVKWLTTVTVLDSEFEGYQMRAYRRRQEQGEEGEPLTRIDPRALVMPPGFPDFMSRTRFVRAGRVVLEGRAWSGWAPVDAVEVSTDRGASWHAAAVEPAPSPRSWSRWTSVWEPQPGRYVLSARARDASGRVQAVGQNWNRGGFANPLVQQVVVVVTA
jgi:DMSO/TMAO reductase YedYZ molybdopterin-dependent catalytic subunit